VKIHPPSLEKMTQIEKLFKIAREKIFTLAQKILATPLNDINKIVHFLSEKHQISLIASFS